MNQLESTKTPGDDLDALMGAFFRAEMPHPWPTFEPTAAPATLPFVPRPAARRFQLPSRLALAASVALLFLSGWMLASRFPAQPTIVTPRLGTEGDATNLKPWRLPPTPVPAGEAPSRPTMDD